jgi:hypothetical protein
MGKYDTFRCDFPIPDGLLFGESQQGDVESEFDEYRITADGRLLCEKWGRWNSPNREGQYVDFTGEIEFFLEREDVAVGEWRRFVFEGGRISGILPREEFGGLMLADIDEVGSRDGS